MQLIRLTYGNGTQIVRVESETDKVLTVRRWHTSSGGWYDKPSKLKRTDPRIHTDVSQADLARALVAKVVDRIHALDKHAADWRALSLTAVKAHLYGDKTDVEAEEYRAKLLAGLVARRTALAAELVEIESLLRA